MKILVTGVAGFIGSYVAQALLARGDVVYGVDNLNDYYDPQLKLDRLAQFENHDNFTFVKMDIADTDAVNALFSKFIPDAVVHLAAQAGVRYSLENPHTYIQSNIVGHLNILEGCRHTPNLQHLVYASSSSVYGGNDKQPFSTTDKVDSPVSLYAATKKSDELMTHCYSHLYKFAATGLRFFTVYGPWGRPDMTPFVFTTAMKDDKAIKVFNHGKMKRDFTYIDDIVNGVIAALDTPSKPDEKGVCHSVYNIGNNAPETLMDYILEIERAYGTEAKKEMMDMQPGDVVETYADIAKTTEDLGYKPTTPISVGIPKFVAWFKDYYGVKH
jgi:UDP-glucuronate 4-epimerase